MPGRRVGGSIHAAVGRRAVVVVALAAVSMTGLSACGSHHHPAAAPATTGAAPSTTTGSRAHTVVHHRVRRHTHRPVRTNPPKRAPASVAPLTGLAVPAGSLERPAVVVKIDNLQQALPQTGPNQADVVYEELVEGGLTRLAAVFQSQYPTTVGPVRSGRLTDEGIADDLDHPVLAYAGANTLFQPQLSAQPVQDVDDDIDPGLFVRDYDRPEPHNLFSDVAGLAATDTTRDPPPALWAFRKSGSHLAGAGVAPASGLSITFPAAAVQWTWNAADGLWLRDQNGAVDTDSSGAQLSASNVIVQFLPYVTSAYVTGEGAGATGVPIPTGQWPGSGTAWYLSGGAVVKGTWTRSSLTSPTVYTDSTGRPIRLQPGRTWVELPEDGMPAAVAP